MTLFDQAPKQLATTPATTQGVNDDRSVKQNRHARFGRMRRLDALSASRRSFLTQAAALPASSISG
jgi:hypothetical protein